MSAVEIACALVLAVYAAAHARTRRWPAEAALLGIAGWIGEVTCVRAYGLYEYDPSIWRVRLDVVPLMVALIWPAVVLSARAIARRLLGPARPAVLALATGALVLFDAALIEPIAVRAGLWSWHEPGLFAVPIVGFLGWGYFATAAAYGLERWPGRGRLAVVVLAPFVTHALLLASWWGALRWTLRGELAPWTGCVAIALASAALTVAALRRGVALPPRETVPRAVATLLFGVLLVGATMRGGGASLAAYAALFAAPHLVMTFARAGRRI